MKNELDQIYREYAGDVYAYALSICRNQAMAQDILQDTMLKAVTSYDTFRGDCSVKSWLCAIAKNLCLNAMKRADNNNLPVEESAVPHPVNIEQQLSDNDTAMRIHKHLHSLDEPYREVFSLRVFAELKFDDIGKIFGKSGNWARVTFFRAKEKLIQLTKEENL
ncbi:MAG: sigma-70 family RNA polymerase sigma factor [Ruminococcus sp.]|nr:sigma-70 family RNA polymerase sigma factor [Ruminococcus sp.]